MIKLFLPILPSAALGGNARGHWSKSHSERADVRRSAMIYAKQLRVPQLEGRQLATVTVYTPRPGVRRDWDNYLKRLKPVWDGIVDAGLLPDDSSEHLVPVQADPLFVRPGKQGEGLLIVFTEGGRR